MTLGLAIDGLIILLLAVAIGYGLVLNQRLRLLRDSRGELEQVVAALTQAISQADAGLTEIHKVAESLGRDLDRKVDGARSHSGELGILVERAENAAERLEEAIGLSRKLDGAVAKADGPKPAPQAPMAKARPTPAKLFVGPAEDEDPLARAGGGSIVKALRGMR